MAIKIDSKYKSGLEFARSWIKKPLQVGAIAPSSRYLAQKMVNQLPENISSPIIELGPGTGVVTREILKKVDDQQQIIAIEYEPIFARNLSEKFPEVTIVTGDAYALDETLYGALSGYAGAIISSLPLLSQPIARRITLLEKAFEILEPGAPFIQFSYGLTAPITTKEFRCKLSSAGWTLRNAPPAQVWVYRK